MGDYYTDQQVDDKYRKPLPYDGIECATHNDPVNHPKHYTESKSGVECIQITEHLNFCLGNAIKYIWRADLKNGLEDLKKAQWYIAREIKRREQNDR